MRSRSARAAGRASLVAFLIALGGIAGPASGSTLQVPSAQYGTIQSAIDAAGNGDVVQVAAGRYRERLTFAGRATITVQGAGAATTTIDGGGAGTAVTFTSNSSTLRGFTITGGSNPQYEGGGVLVNGGSPAIADDVIEGNVAGDGAGIAIHAGSPTISDCIVRDNLESCGSGCVGGGIDVGFNAGTPQILRNVIEGNSSEFGAGIAVESGNPLIQGNVIRRNVGKPINGGSIGGEGIHVRPMASARIVDDLVAENAGGGILLQTIGGEVISIVDTTVAMNGGPALSVDASAGTVQVVNAILVSGGPAATCSGSAAGAVAFKNTDVFGSGGTHQTGCVLSGGGSSASLSLDPQFVDVAFSNYRLRPSSPAIGAGTASMPAGTTAPAIDLDGDPRVQGGTVDLGAYEYQGPVPVSVDRATVDFGAQRVGVASAPVTVTVMNAGATGLQISDVSVTGDYAVATTCRSADGIAPGASCTATVTFLPTARFARQGSLTVRGNVSQVNGAPATPADAIDVAIPLTGTGSAPHVVLSGAALGPGPSLAFGLQRVGIATAPARVVVTNDGEVDLAVASLTVPSPFTATAAGCTTVAANGGTCTIDVAFSPVARGASSGNLALATDAIETPSTVVLSGQGIAPVVTLSQAAVSFGSRRVGDGASAAIALTNTGDASLALASIAASGAPNYTQTNDCPATLAPGSGCTITVALSTSAAGTKQGVLTLRHDSLTPGAETEVGLTAEAVDFALTLYPDPIQVVGGIGAGALVITRLGNDGFAWPVKLSCSGAPSGLPCWFDPSPTLTPGWQSQVMVRLGGSQTAARSRRGGAALALLAAPALAAALAGGRRRRWPWLAAFAVALALGGAVACGGGSSVLPGGGGGGGRPSGGGYTLRVMATSGTLTHEATVVVRGS
jgi:hypothetical protein